MNQFLSNLGIKHLVFRLNSKESYYLHYKKGFKDFIKEFLRRFADDLVSLDLTGLLEDD
jgi:hypothetical protein